MLRITFRGLLILLSTFIATFSFAQETQRYAAIDKIVVSGGEIPAGGEVIILGIIDVARTISPSGRLATIVFEEQFLNLDAALFYEKETANWDYQSLILKDAGETASICTTLFHLGTGKNIDLSNTAMEKFISIRDIVGAVPTFSLTKGNNHESYYRSSSDFCIGGLQYDREYTISFLKGMDARSGWQDSILDADLKFEVKTLSRKPMVSVSGSQNIIPTTGTAVIPVTTVNISELEVIIHHVDIESVSNYADVFSALNGYELDKLQSYWGKEIARHTVGLNAERNVATTMNLNISDLIRDIEPGLFVLSFGYEDQDTENWELQATQWFMVSDISATLYHGLNNTDIFLRDFTSAAVLAEIDVKIIANNNKTLAIGATDATGRVTFRNTVLNGTSGFAPEYLIATSMDHGTTIWQLADLDQKPRTLSSGMAKPNKTDVYLTVARDIYRAGETIDVVGIARNLKVKALANNELEVSLTQSGGTEVFSEFLSTNSDGAFKLKVPTKPTSRLGKYYLSVKSIDGVLLARNEILIDDFVPLTIEPKLFISNEIWVPRKPQDVQINAEYFSGGPAAGLKAELNIELRKTTRFDTEELAGFIFGQSGNGQVDNRNTFELTLDVEGTAAISYTPLESKFTPGIYKYAIEGNVFDVGGRANKTKYDVSFDSHKTYLGVMPSFGGRLEEGLAPSFEVVNVNRAGLAQVIEGASYILSRVYYRYNWYWDDGYGWRYRHIRTSEDIIESGPINSTNLQLNTGLDWGSYELKAKNADGFETTSEFYVGWGSQTGPTTTPEALDLSVKNVGGSGTVRFEAPFAGILSMHVASGDILSSFDLSVKKGQNEVSVDLSLMPEPGGHVLATLVRPVLAGSEHLPQVAIGTAWVENIANSRNIDVDLITASKLKSTEAISVTINADVDTGTAIIFLVDEGIHAISGFSNPDLKTHFFGERALSLGFQSNFGHLIRQDLSLQNYRVGGGDEIAASVAVDKSEFFKTYAEASPLLEIKNGQISHEFLRADMEGSLRMVAFISTPTTVGMSSKSITIQDPVSLDISLPRFVAPGDLIGGKLSVRSNDFEGSFVLRKFVGQQRDETKIMLEPGQSFTTSLVLSTSDIGRIPVIIEAAYNGETIRREFEIVSRGASYPLTQMRALQLKKANLFGSSQTNVPQFDLSDFQKSETIITLSPQFGVNREQVLTALDRYPYGCIEQTSSATRGILMRAQILGLTADTQAKVTTGVDGIMAKQMRSGAFGYWNRNGSVIEQYQPFAIETLMEALPYVEDRERVASSISDGLEYLYRTKFVNIDSQLYAYGLLAQSGFEVTSRARYVLDYKLNLERLTKQSYTNTWWEKRNLLDRLSLAYWVAATLNDQIRMAKLNGYIETAIQGPSDPPSGNTDRGVAAENEMSEEINVGTWTKNISATNFYQSRIVAPRFGHFLAGLSDDQQTSATKSIVRGTKAYITSQPYRSTLMNANLLKIFEAQTDDMSSVTVWLDDAKIEMGQDGVLPISKSQFESGFELRHNSGEALSLTAETVGPRSSSNAINNGYVVRKFWYDKDGLQVGDSCALYPCGTDGAGQSEGYRIMAKQGDLFTVIVDIDRSGKERLGDLLLTDLLPSGFEIEEGIIAPPLWTNGTPIDTSKGVQPDFIQTMDDRFIAHFKSAWISSDFALVSYTVRASYDTTSAIPDAHVENMYSPEINGRSEVGLAVVNAQ